LEARKRSSEKPEEPEDGPSQNGQPEASQPAPTPEDPTAEQQGPPSQPSTEPPTVEPSASVEPLSASDVAASTADADAGAAPQPEPAQPSAASPASDFEPSVEDYKAALLDSFYGTQRGLTAKSEVRAEINELISQLEAKNPMPNPTEDLAQLDGTWHLAYTSNSGLIGILALDRLPLVTVGDVVQRIDTRSGTVENQVGITVPLQRTALSAKSVFEVCSPKRLHLKLEEGKIQTPELINDLDLPDTLAVLGQSVDLTQLKQALAPFKNNLDSLFEQVNSVAAQGPQLAFPIRSEGAQTWQLNTFLDGDMRISRGDGGSIFVYCRSSAP